MNFDLPKILTSAIWLLIVVNLFASFPPWLATTLNITGIVLLVAHFAEYILFRKRIAELPEGPLTAFIMTMLYGLFYWKR